MTRSLVSVVVPVMNEEENLPLFYAEVARVIQGVSSVDWEFVFVDDGSTDSTFDGLLKLRESDSRVRIVRLSKNFGSYNAIRAGFDHSRGRAVICISADLQDPPELFVEFVARWKEGSEIVWAVRSTREDSWGKTLLAKAFYRVISKIALPNLPENGMDVGLFDRKVVDAFLRIPDRNGITFMTIYWMGFRQARIPYHRRARKFGKTKWPFMKRLKAALDTITAFSSFPIRFISYLGLGVSLVSFVGAALVLFNKLVLGLGDMGWPSMMVAILFLGGIQLVMLGLLGEYLWRVGSEVRGLPHYLTMSRIGFEDDASNQR